MFFKIFIYFLQENALAQLVSLVIVVKKNVKRTNLALIAALSVNVT